MKIVPKLYEVKGNKLSVNFHPGQLKAWDSTKRTVAIIAAGRSGKTSFAAFWLHREMKAKGPGDYLVAAPNYPLIDKAAGPEVKAVFEKLLALGEMKVHPPKFVVSDAGAMKLWGMVPDRPSRILFGHADDPESIEAMSAKAAWLDEAGQGKFKLDSWEAVQQRVSLDEGRILITTKPYNLGWMKQKLYDPWKKLGGNHPDIDVINFDSTANPAFPKAEMERARRDLPAWKFDMHYRGLFTRPAGMIYDCFDETRHKVAPFAIPDDWPRHLGLDFGGVNTAGVFLAEELHPTSKKPTGVLYAYREYKAGGRTAKDHARELLVGEPRIPNCVGGSHSEGQWRSEFAAGGLPVREPAVREVEVGIDRVYGTIKRNELMVFNTLGGTLDQLLSYSRETDEAGEPTEKIENKADWHYCDALRYIAGWLKRTSGHGIGVGVDLPPRDLKPHRDSNSERRGMYGR